METSSSSEATSTKQLASSAFLTFTCLNTVCSVAIMSCRVGVCVRVCVCIA